MCHDPEYVAQLQSDLRHFTRLARRGDERAALSAERTSLELEALGVRPQTRSAIVETIIRELNPQPAQLDLAS